MRNKLVNFQLLNHLLHRVSDSLVDFLKFATVFKFSTVWWLTLEVSTLLIVDISVSEPCVFFRH